jgi:zinc transport system ATP-binding protein
MAADPPVRFAGVSFAFEDLEVLRDVNLDIEAGDTVSVVGPNGGGKTTLLKLILGLLRPSQGSVRLFGRGPEQGRKHAGYVPQQVLYDPQFPMQVEDVVLMGRLGSRWAGPYSRSDRSAARSALKAVGLAGLEHRGFATLSGGQRQRVLIARALASEAALLLLDEPTSHVDRTAERELYALLGELSKKLTLVMASHDLGVVWSLTNKVICVNVTAKIHPTADLTGEMIQALYAHDVTAVRHREEVARRGRR